MNKFLSLCCSALLSLNCAYTNKTMRKDLELLGYTYIQFDHKINASQRCLKYKDSLYSLVFIADDHNGLPIKRVVCYNDKDIISIEPFY